MQEILIRFANHYKLNEIEVLQPYNNIKILWDMVHFFIIMLLLFTIPIDICFAQELEQQFKVVLGFFLTTDIFICMNTSYFNKGFIVKERRRIITHYFTHDFLADVLTTFLCLQDLRNYGYFNLFKMGFFLRFDII